VCVTEQLHASTEHNKINSGSVVGRRHLVSIKVNDHGTFDVFNLIEEKADCKRDVGVNTESASAVGAAVMKASANVDSPASLHSQSCCLSAINNTVHRHSTDKLGLFSCQQQ